MKPLNIRTRMALGMIILGIGPLLLLGGITLWRGITIQTEQTILLQQEKSKRVASEIQQHLKGLETTLQTILHVHGLENNQETRQLLSNLMAYQNHFESLVLADSNGQELMHFHRINVIPPGDLKNWSGNPLFTEVITQKYAHYSPIHYSPETGEPLITLMIPYLDAFKTHTMGVLVADIRFNTVWNLIAEIKTDQGEHVFMVNENGLILAHRNPTVVLRETRVTLPSEGRMFDGLDGKSAMISQTPLILGDQHFIVVVEKELFMAVRQTIYLGGLIIFLTLVSLLMIGVQLYLANRTVIRPILHLADVAQKIESGDFSGKAVVSNTDEIGILAQAFNNMMVRLCQVMQSLEVKIAEHEQTLVTLAETEQRLRAIIDNTPSLIFLKDKDLRFMMVNKSYETLFHTTQEYLSGKTVYELFPPDVAEIFQKNDHLILRDKQPMVFEEEVIDGNVINTYLTTRFPLINNQGEIYALCGIATDITERKHQENELRDARDKAESMNRLKTSFLANMSHEIRTPLNGIMGFAYLLQSATQDPEYQEYTTRMLNSCQRLLHTINDILDLSKLESGKDELKLIAFDLVHEARKAIQLLEPLASAKQLSLEVIPQKSSMYACLELNSFCKILNNLVGNAIKFTSQGYIRVTFDQQMIDQKSWAIISVEDSGIGISEAFLPHVFDEFKQESDGYARSFQGTGLGLTITRKLVDLLDGQISVSSQKGKGACFTVKFLSVDGPKMPLMSIEDTLVPIAHNLPDDLAILLVEDDRSNQEIAKHFLGKNCRLDVVSSGEDALKAISNVPYDLVLLDIHLGSGKDGTQVLSEIRQMPQFLKKPVIAVTAYTMKGDRERFLHQGFNDYLAKPYTKDSLFRTLYRAIHRELERK
ncbi:MAG: response regulator, partial [SAR324 cluster bacterium]|nr:response regulator [SAR324 cluster bacterium]